MNKKGKKVYKNVLIVLLVITVLLTFGGCKKTDEIDERVQAALETYFVDSDRYSCFFEVETVGASDASDPVDLVQESYSIVADKSAKIIRVTLLEVITYPGNEEGMVDWDVDPEYQSFYKSWYLTVEDDVVTVYAPKEDQTNTQSFYGYGNYTYEKIVFEDEVLAADISAVFFPQNMDFMKGTFVSSQQSSYFEDTLKADTTNRTLQVDLFANIVASLTGVDGASYSDMDLEVELYTEAPEDSSYPLISMQVENFEALYAYVAEAYTGEPYTNGFIERDLPYTQYIYINFYEDMLYDEPIELPVVD